MAGIAVPEGTTTLTGAALSHLLDSVPPGSLSVEVDIDLDADLDLGAVVASDLDGASHLDGIGSPQEREIELRRAAQKAESRANRP
jgi:hypothetical protein